MSCNNYQGKLRIESMYEKVRQGLISSTQYCGTVRSELARTHELTKIELDRRSKRSLFQITSMDLDPVENKFLLMGKADGGVAIYDTSKLKRGRYLTEVAKLGRVMRRAHSLRVSCVQWYPVDAGLFVTAGENMVKVWDPNRMCGVERFVFKHRIHHLHMSPVASKHSLIAVAGNEGDIFLCDLRSGSSTHRLFGHDGQVTVVQWSRQENNCLASGGLDQTIRIWDVRSGKACLKMLDGNLKSENRRLLKRIRTTPTAHQQRITSLCFSYDGLWLISLSPDGRLKVWNSSTYEKRNINFCPISSDILKPVLLGLSYNTYPDLIFVPSDNYTVVYNMNSGKIVNYLENPFGSTLGVIYNPRTMDVYNYGENKTFLLWSPYHFLPKKDICDEGKTVQNKPHSSRRACLDCWSDED